MKVQIPLSIESDLLKQVEDTEGKNRSQKIVNLVALGLKTLCDHPQPVTEKKERVKFRSLFQPPHVEQTTKTV
jgi:hypothetical protein